MLDITSQTIQGCKNEQFFIQYFLYELLMSLRSDNQYRMARIMHKRGYALAEPNGPWRSSCFCLREMSRKSQLFKLIVQKQQFHRFKSVWPSYHFPEATVEELFALKVPKWKSYCTHIIMVVLGYTNLPICILLHSINGTFLTPSNFKPLKLYLTKQRVFLVIRTILSFS